MYRLDEMLLVFVDVLTSLLRGFGIIGGWLIPLMPTDVLGYLNAQAKRGLRHNGLRQKFRPETTPQPSTRSVIPLSLSK
jgi:hypothetical protein